MKKACYTAMLLLSLSLLQGCGPNPFGQHNGMTGRPEGVATGAVIGAGSMALIGAGSKPYMATAAVIGGVIGYYVTTDRFAAGGILEGGGKIYGEGQYIGIVIPLNKLFEPNTADFLPSAYPILDSVVSVLERYPNNNILISGNTSGFGRQAWEQPLSEKQAGKVAAYLWNAGINAFKNPGINTRELRYVGYGSAFPIANTLTNRGIQENGRIQITSYPSRADLCLDKRFHVLKEEAGA